MKLSSKLSLVALTPLLAHCAVQVRTRPLYVPPPPTVAVTVDTPAPPAPPAPPPPPVADAAPPTDYDDNDPSALTDFHPALDQHGTWYDDSKYGTVWAPSPAEVGPDFVPYSSGGHWTYGDDYTWVSDYDWGWAPFHYGRWVEADRGWSWIPGRVYAPSWVTWSTPEPGYAYVGWAPAPPEYYWRGGSYVTVDWVVQPRYGYVGTGNMFAPHFTGGMVLRGNAAVNISAHMHPQAAGGGGGGAVGGGFHGHSAGPAPSAVGIPANKVTAPPANNPGLAKAKAFGSPATAATVGGHPPVHVDHTIKNDNVLAGNHNTTANTQANHGAATTPGRQPLGNEQGHGSAANNPLDHNAAHPATGTNTLDHNAEHPAVGQQPGTNRMNPAIDHNAEHPAVGQTRVQPAPTTTVPPRQGPPPTSAPRPGPKRK